MKKVVRKTCLLSLVFVLLFAFMFSATSCSASPNIDDKVPAEVYNEGYEKLYNYIEENNNSTSGGIKYSKDTKKDCFIFTSLKNKGSDILVTATGYKAGEIKFTLTKKGVSDDNFLTIEITSLKSRDYYYKGTTLLMSTEQTSFTIINEKQSLEKNGYGTNVSSSVASTVNSLLKAIVALEMLNLYDFIENTIGIPMELFAGK